MPINIVKDSCQHSDKMTRIIECFNNYKIIHRSTTLVFVETTSFLNLGLPTNFVFISEDYYGSSFGITVLHREHINKIIQLLMPVEDLNIKIEIKDEKC